MRRNILFELDWIEWTLFSVLIDTHGVIYAQEEHELFRKMDRLGLLGYLYDLDQKAFLELARRLEIDPERLMSAVKVVREIQIRIFEKQDPKYMNIHV